jgi:hypothetical protein
MRVAGVVLISLLVVSSLAWGQRDDPGFTVGSTNILGATAGGQIIGFSSQMLDENKKPVKQWQVTNLIDGKHVTGTYRPEDSHGWSSNVAPRPGQPEWIIFAFKDERTRLISRLVLDPNTVDPLAIGRSAQDFELYVSTTTKDGPWAMVKSGRLLNRPVKQTFDFLPVEARYVKLLINTNWGSDRFVGLGEVEIYESIAGDDVLDQLIIRLENLLRDLKRYRDSIRLNQPLHPEVPAVPAAPAAAPAAPAAGG